MTHEALVGRGARWLQSNRRCEPVLHGINVTAEIPDAIGWSSSYKFRGSHVLECKASRSDFIRDRHKGRYLVGPSNGYGGHHKVKWPAKDYLERMRQPGWTEHRASRMGDFRWIACPDDLLSVTDIERYAPDHGLLWCNGSNLRVVVQREAPRRAKVNHAAEVRLLRGALIHISYNLAAHGCTVHLPTLTKFDGAKGLTLPTEQVKL
jgi:hypothetical protein